MALRNRSHIEDTLRLASAEPSAEFSGKEGTAAVKNPPLYNSHKTHPLNKKLVLQ